MRRPLTERFWEKVDKNGPTQSHMSTPCWVWTGAVSKNGYGSIGSGGKHGRTLYAHVVAFELQYGPLPPGKMVLHSCDVKLCMHHIYAGTHADNMYDRHARGRTHSGEAHSQVMQLYAARGARNGSHTHPERRPRGASHGSKLHPELVLRGSHQPNAKLTEASVQQLRADAASGLRNIDLQRKYGISCAAVSGIISRKTWRHI